MNLFTKSKPAPSFEQNLQLTTYIMECNNQARAALGAAYVRAITPYINLIQARVKREKKLSATKAMQLYMNESDPDKVFDYNSMLWAAALADILFPTPTV